MSHELVIPIELVVRFPDSANLEMSVLVGEKKRLLRENEEMKRLLDSHDKGVPEDTSDSLPGVPNDPERHLKVCNTCIFPVRGKCRNPDSLNAGSTVPIKDCPDWKGDAKKIQSSVSYWNCPACGKFVAGKSVGGVWTPRKHNHKNDPTQKCSGNLA